MNGKEVFIGKLLVIVLLMTFSSGCFKAGTDDVIMSDIPEELIDPADLIYQGTFRLPSGSSSDSESWGWGGTAMAYYPDGDPNGPSDGYPGSIYGTGNDQYQYISEVSIPVPVVSSTKNLGELNTAGTLQGFTDVRGDLFGELELPRAGIAYLERQEGQSNGKLYYAWGQHMQEWDRGPSHGWFDLDLSEPNIAGPWSLRGQIKYNTTDYIFDIPENWADEHVPGFRLATGRYRDGGQGSQGPVLIAYGPWKEGNPPPANAVLSNKPLLLYSSVYDDPDGEHAMEGYQHSDEWSGGAWLTTEDRAAVVFIGFKGKGDCWYGYQDGTIWPEGPPYPPEGPGQRGWWSEGRDARIVFYDPSDLAKVAIGEMEPFEPQPYASLNINDMLWNMRSDEIYPFGSLSFDRERGLLYAFEFRGDSENDAPLVHVWKIE